MAEPAPAAVIARGRLAILDAVACALAAVDEEPAASTLAMVEGLGGAPQCRVIGTPMRTSVANAVLANGVLVRALDYNDMMGGATVGGHPGDNVAVALSVGEWRGCSGRDVVNAVIMAYELYARLQALIDRSQPWDHTSASGLVAPAVAGVLMGLEPARLAHAIAISAAHAVTLAAIRGGNVSSSKSIANAMVAHTGTVAALLAERGLTGPLAVAESERGAGRGVTARALRAVLAPHDGRYRIMDATVKAFPCIGTAQAAIAAALEIRRQLPRGLPPVDKIVVRMADTRQIRAQLAEEGRRYPTSREAADHSFYFLLAAALMDGEMTARQFDHERWLAPDVQALMNKMDIRADSALNERAPGGFPCAIDLLLAGGEHFAAAVDHAPGHPSSGDVGAVVGAKFDACARGRLSPDRAAKVRTDILSLERQPSLAVIMGNLVPAAG